MKAAINRNIINKASRDILKKHNGTFESIDVSIHEFASLINQGYAFCAQHSGKRRASRNFTSAGFLAVDIDYGLTLDEAMQDDYVQKYASMLYTTPSHTDSLNRFRIVFELDEEITDKESMEYALTALIGQFGADGACKDACRVFFGSKNSFPIVYGNRLPANEVERLIIRGKELSVPPETCAESGRERRHTIRSRLSIPKQTVVRSADNARGRLEDFPSQTRIYCPQHLDRHPSAITLRSRRDVPGFFCSACNATFFCDDGDRPIKKEPYRFDYQWDSIFNVSLEEYTAYTDEDGRFSLSELREWSIKEVNQKYLPDDESLIGLVECDPSPKDKELSLLVEMSRQYRTGLLPHADITFVKSPKGSGKTEWLKKRVDEYKQEGKSVLLIGHRRSLISATAKRVGLDCYLKSPDVDADEGTVSYRPPTNHYAICVDSLPKLDPKWRKYDVVLLDESEQVFAHLLSSTLRENRREVLHLLRHYLNAAQFMYLLDADLGLVTIEILNAMLDERDRQLQTIVNRHTVEQKTLYLYDAPRNDHLIGELIESLRKGERCFVCSNSKKFVSSLEQEIQRQMPHIKSIAITSDNSMKPETQAFVRDIKLRALEYDVIFTSPALGTGIDITFDDDAQLIDTVYGFFQARINTHFDIDQQLSRVRNPKRINVWISPEEFNFETDIGAIRAELYQSESEHRLLLNIKPDGTKEFHHDPLYDTVFATITGLERASKNHLRRNLIELRKSNGWRIETVSAEKNLSDLGKEVRQGAKARQQKIEIQSTCGARKITADEYEELRSAEKERNLTTDEMWPLRRYEIESFYRCEATTELLRLDNGGSFRDQLKAYELLTEPDEELARQDQYYERRHIADKPQYLFRKQILKTLFDAAGIMHHGVFDSFTVIDTTQLNVFIEECKTKTLHLERLFKISLRNDLVKKPIYQLQLLLKLVGLQLTKKKRDQSGGQSKILYGLCESKLEILRQWAEKRADPILAEKWKNERKIPAERDTERPTVPIRKEYRGPLEMD